MGKQKARACKGPHLALENNIGSSGDLGEVATGKGRQESIEGLRVSLDSWMRNSDFDEFRDKKLDLAIVAMVNKDRMNHQDVDNLSKQVLDALKKPKDGKSKVEGYLFNDDCQVVRLLVYKLLREDDERYDTDEISISFREYDPSRQMILESLEVI